MGITSQIMTARADPPPRARNTIVTDFPIFSYRDVVNLLADDHAWVHDAVRIKALLGGRIGIGEQIRSLLVIPGAV